MQSAPGSTFTSSLGVSLVRSVFAQNVICSRLNLHLQSGCLLGQECVCSECNLLQAQPSHPVLVLAWSGVCLLRMQSAPGSTFTSSLGVCLVRSVFAQNAICSRLNLHLQSGCLLGQECVCSECNLLQAQPSPPVWVFAWSGVCLLRMQSAPGSTFTSSLGVSLVRSVFAQNAIRSRLNLHLQSGC